MKKTAKQTESQVQLFGLFSVEELESRLEFKRREGRGRSRRSLSNIEKQARIFCNALNNIGRTD